VVFGYVLGLLRASPALAREIVSVKRNEIELRNGIVIAVHSNSFRTVRGRTLVACIMDEVSFWRDDTTANPDIETYRAVLPSLATTNGMLVGISTPYRRIGLLHQKHRDHYGQDGDDVLVVQGASQRFNPSLSDAVLDAQRGADPTASLSEWDAEFRSDISSFLDDRLIEAAIEIGRPLELPPMLQFGAPTYAAFTDPSGGVGSDSYTLAVGHKEDELFVLDLVRGTEGSFDPAAKTRDYAAVLKDFHLTTVTGDHYATSWVSSAWAEAGVSYVKSELPKSQIYLETLPLFTRGPGAAPRSPEASSRATAVGAPHPSFRQGYRRPSAQWPRRPCQRGVRSVARAFQPVRLGPHLQLGGRRQRRPGWPRRLAANAAERVPENERDADMSERHSNINNFGIFGAMAPQNTTTAELRRNAIAALWLLAVVTAGAFLLAALF
jgi:hypothetical protein